LTTGLAPALRLVALACAAASGPALADALPLDALAEQEPPTPPLPASPTVPSGDAPPASPWARWFNPATAPFIPVPLITTDPNSGTTVGVLPTWLDTDEEHHIDRIIAPDVQYNPYFGWGAHARVLEFPSEDVQWSAVAGFNERVQRTVDLEYEKGRLRDERWSFSASLIYTRDGTPRYYGIGNDTAEVAGTNYTSNTDLAELQVGRNLSHALQLEYTVHFQSVDVLPGTLPGIPSVQTLFPDTLGTTHEILNRVSAVYDTRDDLTVPTRGIRWSIYTGFASHSAFGEPAYTEAGVDGSAYWPLRKTTIVAMHVALRYLPTAQDPAFWELSTLGGGDSIIGGAQPLRGFGADRFTGRNSSSFTAEVRQRVAGLGLFNTNLELEVDPFVDLGRVFDNLGTLPVSALHKVVGVGFRGIARPFIVGRVDLGYGSEGAAVFTGIAYPF
jgi:hypothetical protein